MAKGGKGEADRTSLWEAFAQVPDPRDARGRRHPLQAVLTLASVAVLSGARSLYAVAQFGRDQEERGPGFAAAPGFTREGGRTPCCATVFNLFRDPDREAFEAALRRRARGRCASAGWEAAAVDGKAVRGIRGHEAPGVHLLAEEG
jgi:hypothetical protein